MIPVWFIQIMLQDSKVFEMMTLAQDLGVDELKIACEEHVKTTMSVANACTFLAAVMEIQEKASGEFPKLFKSKCFCF